MFSILRDTKIYICSIILVFFSVCLNESIKFFCDVNSRLERLLCYEEEQKENTENIQCQNCCLFSVKKKGYLSDIIDCHLWNLFDIFISKNRQYFK